VGADRPTELPEAADGLATQGVQAIMQISDSSSSTGFGTIIKAADRANIPVFAFAPGAMNSGATIAVSRDFEEVGRISARLMDKVLRGESPGNLPFADPQETVFLVNPERMKQFGIVLPKDMLDTARAVTEGDGATK
jgi:putative ABC transport system substrate-binding protein